MRFALLNITICVARNFCHLFLSQTKATNRLGLNDCLMLQFVEIIKSQTCVYFCCPPTYHRTFSLCIFMNGVLARCNMRT